MSIVSSLASDIIDLDGSDNVDLDNPDIIDLDEPDTPEEKAFQQLKDCLDNINNTSIKLDRICEHLEGMFLNLDNESDFEMNEVTNFAYDLMFSTDAEERMLGDQLEQVVKSINALVDSKNEDMQIKPQLTLDFDYTPAEREDEYSNKISDADKQEFQQAEKVDDTDMIQGLNVSEVQKSVKLEPSVEIHVGGEYDESLQREQILRKFDNILKSLAETEKTGYGFKEGYTKSYDGIKIKIRTIHDNHVVLANYVEYAEISRDILDKKMIIVQLTHGCRVYENTRVIVQGVTDRNKADVINNLYFVVPDNRMRGTAGKLFSMIRINNLQLIGIDFQYFESVYKILEDSDIKSVDLRNTVFLKDELDKFKEKANELDIKLFHLETVKLKQSKANCNGRQVYVG